MNDVAALLAPVLLGAMIGAVLGGLGGGGAILTVPALVYVIGETPREATAASLVIVGLTALVASVAQVRAGRVDGRVAAGFVVLGLPATWAGGRLNHRADPDVLLMGFAALMVVAAAAMLADSVRPRPGPPVLAADELAPAAGGAGTALAERTRAIAPPRTSAATLVLLASGVGLLTGFLGVGGGFVIVPALVLALRLPMPVAVGTSLVVIAANSATALAGRLGSAHLDASVVVPFTLAAMLATLAGKQVADRLPTRRLQVGFAVLMLLVAAYTIVRTALG